MKLKLFLMAALVCAATAFAADDFELGPVVAKGKGLEVRRGELDDAFIAYSANLAARGSSIPAGQRQSAEAQLLDRIIITQLLVTNSIAADRIAAKTNAARFTAEAWKNADSPEGFYRHLKSLGLTPAQFTNRAMERAVSEEVVRRELTGGIKISDADVKRFYETNSAPFTQPELARVSHILIATRDLQTGLPYTPEQKTARKEKAQKLLERARKGEDFAKLVQENSEEPGVKEDKGEYKFARAKDDPRRAMVPEFEKATFAMKSGEISDLVTSEYGFHIIKLHEIIPPRKTPLADAEQQIRDHLTQMELEKRMPAFFARLKKDAGVEIVDERLKTVLEKLAQEEARRPAL
ncbi:MAG TPA: peptidylprolyl isomerase [Candidatus Acidoferrum sp.]|nr:peptidylprolyl isomerase [Candidatus Acidoferrum sp.]